MKKIRIFASLLVVATVLSVNSIKANAEWVQNGDGGWKYMVSENRYYVGPFEDNGKHYYADKNGIMQTGWIHNDKSWYYANEDGSFKIGWFQDGGKWYYFNSPNGNLITSAWVGEYYVGSDGAWEKTDKSKTPTYGDVSLEDPNNILYNWTVATIYYRYDAEKEEWIGTKLLGMVPDDKTWSLFKKYALPVAIPKDKGKDGEERQVTAWTYLGN